MHGFYLHIFVVALKKILGKCAYLIFIGSPNESVALCTMQNSSLFNFFSTYFVFYFILCGLLVEDARAAMVECAPNAGQI